jgi:hypothetical protein
MDPVMTKLPVRAAATCISGPETRQVGFRDMDPRDYEAEVALFTKRS